ncbi:MAG: FHIPEP family type III secretion protein [Pirellulales bacterium]
MAALREILIRYIGRSVAVQSYGYRRYIGAVAAVTDEFVVLKNATALDDYEGSRWDDEAIHWRVKEGVDTGFAETVLTLASIVAVTSSDNEGLEPIEKELQPGKSDEPSLREIANREEWIEAHYDAIEIQLGSQIVSHFSSVINELLDRIGSVRKQLHQDMGFEFPKVRIRDSLSLKEDQYSIKIAGTPRGGGQFPIDKLLALGPESKLIEFAQPIIKEPVFGLPAIWISADQKTDAELRGLNVHSLFMLLAAHLKSLLLSNIREIYNYEMTCKLMNDLSITSPALHQEYFSGYSCRARLHELLLSLMSEGVFPDPIERIAEAVAISSSESSDELVDRVRFEIVNSMLRPAVDAVGQATRIELSREILEELPQIVESDELSNRFRVALLQFANHAANYRALVLVVPYEFRRAISGLVSEMRTLVMVISTEEFRQSKLRWKSVPFSVDNLCGIGSDSATSKSVTSVANHDARMHRS